jgi:uncharacterized protein (TIGR03435 family)
MRTNLRRAQRTSPVRSESRELLAVGIFGHASIGDRIEILLKRGREFSTQVSPARIAAGAVVLLIFVIAGSLAPRWIAFAQQPSAPLAFEAASVKPNKSSDRPYVQLLPSGRLVVANVPLLALVLMGYDVPPNRLSGGPDWIRSDRFDIEGTPPAGAIPAGASSNAREQAVRQMVQALLADRFKLVVRRETKELPVYAILVGKNGPKLEKSKLEEKDCAAAESAENGVRCHSSSGGRGRGIHGEAVDMSDLASFVSPYTDRAAVVDKTGIKGLFNIQTGGWLPMQTGPPPAPDAKGEDGRLLIDQPTVFQIFESLGLRLEPQKGPVETFVIDHAERPDAN